MSVPIQFISTLSTGIERNSVDTFLLSAGIELNSVDIFLSFVLSGKRNLSLILHLYRDLKAKPGCEASPTPKYHLFSKFIARILALIIKCPLTHFSPMSHFDTP